MANIDGCSWIDQFFLLFFSSFEKKSLAWVALGQPTFWLQAGAITATKKRNKSAGGKKRENFIERCVLCY
ncbi:MAG: hypothetical protein ACKVU0_01400 [Saprospiraceae bacterium]